MLKSFMLNLNLLYPLMINILIMIMLMMPSKINKLHPMSLLMILIMTTILISLKMNFIYYSWLSFIVFLIMIGGLMIIYMYISSLTNNELFYMNLFILKSYWKMIILMIIMIYMYMYSNKYYNLQECWNNFYSIMYDSKNINMLYQKMNNNATYFIMWYLYYTMICVMNICYMNKMPLRQLTN